MAVCAHVAVSLPVQIFGVSFICRTGEIAGLYGIVTLAAFDFNRGSVSMLSFTSMPFAPAILAWMLNRSVFGPLSIHSCIAFGE